MGGEIEDLEGGGGSTLEEIEVADSSKVGWVDSSTR